MGEKQGHQRLLAQVTQKNKQQTRCICKCLLPWAADILWRKYGDIFVQQEHRDKGVKYYFQFPFLSLPEIIIIITQFGRGPFSVII